MASEDVLPKELDKLEITHTLPQIKLMDSNLPVQLNPFFENDLKDTGTANNAEQTTNTITMKPFLSLNSKRGNNQNCRRCRFRRASESGLDELKHSTNILWNSADNARTPPSGVIKQALKKGISSSTSGSGNRKILLREPVLKALQTCLHPHSNVRRKLLATATSTEDGSGNSTMTTKGMSDFRDLIEECHNLLSEDVDFSGKLNQLCLSNRNSKNFTTIQTPKIQTNKTRHQRRAVLKSSILSLQSPETTALHAHHTGGDSMSLVQQQLLDSNISSTNLQQRISNLLPEQVSAPARYNTSCSQQAGNSTATTVCDDVTIDELASYFDTFVHIPKKMSSMAEMMYI